MVLMDFGCFSHLLEKYEIIYEAFKNRSFLAIFEQKAWAIAHGFDRFWVFFTPFGNYEIFLSKMSKMGHFWAKSMGYSPWFWWILGVFHTFWEKYELFIKLSKMSKWVIFEQKAWAIAHGFDRFWVFFTPFGKIWKIYSFKNVKMGHFWAKSMGYSPWFWWILGHFHTFWKNMKFIKLSKTVIFGHFWAKSMGYSPWFWWILGVFHTFWKNMKLFQKFQKWVIFGHFEQKAWAIAHGFDGFWVFFTPFGKIWIIYKAFKNSHFWPFWSKKHGL